MTKLFDATQGATPDVVHLSTATQTDTYNFDKLSDAWLTLEGQREINTRSAAVRAARILIDIGWDTRDAYHYIAASAHWTGRVASHPTAT